MVKYWILYGFFSLSLGAYWFALWMYHRTFGWGVLERLKSDYASAFCILTGFSVLWPVAGWHMATEPNGYQWVMFIGVCLFVSFSRLEAIRDHGKQ